MSYVGTFIINDMIIESGLQQAAAGMALPRSNHAKLMLIVLVS
jgi:hypothetical protein